MHMSLCIYVHMYVVTTYLDTYTCFVALRICDELKSLIKVKKSKRQQTVLYNYRHQQAIKIKEK